MSVLDEFSNMKPSRGITIETIRSCRVLEEAELSPSFGTASARDGDDSHAELTAEASSVDVYRLSSATSPHIGVCALKKRLRH